VGATVRDLDDRAIGVVHDVYRVGGAEVFVVRGEPYGEFDLPVVRAFIRIFAPARGEIVVDVAALALEPAKPARPARPPRARKGEGRRVAMPMPAPGASAGEAAPPNAGAPAGSAGAGAPVEPAGAGAPAEPAGDPPVGTSAEP
jgi:hypothetical protein